MDNRGDSVFHPVTREGFIVGISLCIIRIILMFIAGKINIICFFIVLLLLIFFLLILVLFPKKTYIKISDEYLIIGGLDIPTFKTVEKYIYYNNVESINIVCMGIYIKEKDQEKK